MCLKNRMALKLPTTYAQKLRCQKWFWCCASEAKEPASKPDKHLLRPRKSFQPAFYQFHAKKYFMTWDFYFTGSKNMTPFRVSDLPFSFSVRTNHLRHKGFIFMKLDRRPKISEHVTHNYCRLKKKRTLNSSVTPSR